MHPGSTWTPVPKGSITLSCKGYHPQLCECQPRVYQSVPPQDLFPKAGDVTSTDGLTTRFTWLFQHHLDEDENLWIASRLIWFDQPRAPEKFFRCSNIQISFKATDSEDETSQTPPVKIGPSS
ncbi:hypothetical protein STEG23_008820 [Scotinomys teguina]